MLLIDNIGIMEIFEYDLLILGSGIAGFTTAIHALEQNKNLKIAVISKLHAMRSHSVSAEGGISGVLYPENKFDSETLHAYDTIKGSDYLADQDAVEILVKNAPKEIRFFEHLGVPWNRDVNGNVLERPFGGMSIPRTAFAADKTGFFMMRALYDQAVSTKQIDILHENFATKIIRGENSFGVFAIDMNKGKMKLLIGKVCIIATGGFSRIYQFTTTAHSSTGDGIALAYEAGCAIKDIEFVQFHPTALVPNGILITEAARGEGGYLLNKNNERFMKNYASSKMELAPRDIISRAIITEIQEGKGIIDKDSNMAYVYLDLRHLGKNIINTKLPMIKEICIKTIGLNPEEEPIPVRPAAHFTMGGIDTDINGKVLDKNGKQIKGMFAVGECGCVSVHGANRLGSNSLSQCAVWGRIVGKEAAEFSSTVKELDKQYILDIAKAEENRIENLINKKGRFSVYQLQEEMRKTMESYFYVYKNTKDMKKGIKKLLEIKKMSNDIKVEDKSTLYNTNLRDVLEFKNQIELSCLVALGALNRKESRGAHASEEYKKRNDKDWLKHTIIFKEGKSAKIKYRDVKITKWKPEERHY